MGRLLYSTPWARRTRKDTRIWNIVCDSKWRHILLCTQNIYQICCWHLWLAYNTYKKYVEDPDCYDWRSENKKKKYDTKLCMRREFPVRMKNRMCYYTSCMLSMCPNECYMHAVRQATWMHWILFLWSLQPKLAAAQKIYSMVAKVKGGSFNHHSNSIRHL